MLKFKKLQYDIIIIFNIYIKKNNKNKFDMTLDNYKIIAENQINDNKNQANDLGMFVFLC